MWLAVCSCCSAHLDSSRRSRLSSERSFAKYRSSLVRPLPFFLLEGIFQFFAEAVVTGRNCLREVFELVSWRHAELVI